MKTENDVLTDAGETVLSFIQAVNSQDFNAARQYASDDMQFIGVLGSRDGADIYFKDMEKMKFKYNIKKVFADEDDVCLFYDIDMGGITAFSSGWYHLKDGRIDAIRVIFDPRPVLEAREKKK